MQHAINNIVQHLFHKNQLEEVSYQELKAFAEQYPYSAIGHYLYTQKNFDAGLFNAEEQQTTAMYFSNPLWLQWLLTNHRPAEDIQEDISNGNLAIEQVDIPVEVYEETETAITDPLIIEERAIDAEITVEAADDIEMIKEQTHEQPETKPAEENSAQVTLPQEDFVSEEIHGVEEVNEGSVAREQYVSMAWDKLPEAPANMEAGADDEAINDTEIVTVTPAALAVDERPIAFQSYHTIDYFASQGIKLQPADFTKDKLGQQLKSFTEWLRSMKKLPAPASGQEEINPDEATRRLQVTRIAEYSIQEKEILTEAMAEVWAKQGNREKAIAIYDKLSLQNPHKNAYFAAKVDQLKVS
ncbi:MAG: hypothetical protein ABI687_08180 [Flavitalea sp.]